MTVDIERGIREFLVTVLDGAPITFDESFGHVEAQAITVSGVQATLHCNIADDVLPGHLPIIVISVRDLNHVAGELYTPQIGIGVSTPAKIAGITEATHRAIVAAIRGAWSDDNVEALDTAMLAEAGASCRSWFVEGFSDSTDKDRWQTEMKLKLCLVEQS